jgi:hypothetical protein
MRTRLFGFPEKREMSMLQENLDLFVKGIFGETAIIDGVEVWGVMDENHEAMFGDSGLSSEGKNITFLVKSSDIFFVNNGSSVSLRSRFFEVINSRLIDDGKLTLLVLKER